MAKSGFNPTRFLACLQAIEAARKGDYALLDARLAACLAGLTTISMDELQFIRERGFKPVAKRNRGPRKMHRVTRNQESLRVARVFIEASKGYTRGHIRAGWDAAIKEHGSKNTVRKHLRRARQIASGKWWKQSIWRVRKGKSLERF
jgi:hypothetical protein